MTESDLIIDQEIQDYYADRVMSKPDDFNKLIPWESFFYRKSASHYEKSMVTRHLVVVFLVMAGTILIVSISSSFTYQQPFTMSYLGILLFLIALLIHFYPKHLLITLRYNHNNPVKNKSPESDFFLIFNVAKNLDSYNKTENIADWLKARSLFYVYCQSSHLIDESTKLANSNNRFYEVVFKGKVVKKASIIRSIPQIWANGSFIPQNKLGIHDVISALLKLEYSIIHLEKKSKKPSSLISMIGELLDANKQLLVNNQSVNNSFSMPNEYLFYTKSYLNKYLLSENLFVRFLTWYLVLQTLVVFLFNLFLIISKIQVNGEIFAAMIVLPLTLSFGAAHNKISLS